MLKILFPYIKLYRHYAIRIIAGMLLAILTLSASIFLLSLSGWFLSATAFVGVAGLYTFNYMLPAAGVRGAAITRTAARYFERILNHDTTFKILTYLRTRAFKHILPLSAIQIQQYQKADLLNRFIADIDNLDHLYLKLFSPIVSGLIVTLLIYFGLSQFNLLLAVLVTLILLATILVIPIIFYHSGKLLGLKLTEQKSEYRQALVSYLQGQTELNLFHAKTDYRQQLDQIEQYWLTNQKKQTTLVSLSAAMIVLIIGAITVLTIWLVADITPHHNQPIIALFIFVGLSCSEILAPIPNAFIFLGQVIASAKRMNEITEQPPAILFPTQGQKLDLSYCELEFNNISFGYPNQPSHVFKKVNLTIKNGQHIALIGQTGCGKSTFLNLITRFWLPNSGKITINQIDISLLDEPTLRNTMSVVPQIITIFSDTLRNNLLIANPNASDEQLIQVLNSVALEKLINTKEGLNIWLGENGRALSGGEKRRIGIARALLHNAPLILMDEPTESLDNHTEQQILAMIKKHYQHKTLIIITHRFTQNELFDRTFLLENGTLTETTY